MKVKIEQLQEERQMYLEMAASITAPLNPVKVQTSGIADRVGNNTCKAADLAAQIDEEVAALWEKQNLTRYMLIFLQRRRLKATADKICTVTFFVAI